MDLTTPQESFWAGDFGDEYIERNGLTPRNMASYIAKWVKILSRIPNSINSILEIGPNIGLNLRALNVLLPDIELSGVEINSKAAGILRKWGVPTVHNESILSFCSEKKYDLVFTSGVLIHINPEKLSNIYERIYALSSRYIVICEYYSPDPVEICYRGHAERLYKRDFAGDMLSSYSDIRLNDYGFIYRRDPHFTQDESNWFILEKQ